MGGSYLDPGMTLVLGGCVESADRVKSLDGDGGRVRCGTNLTF